MDPPLPGQGQRSGRRADTAGGPDRLRAQDRWRPDRYRAQDRWRPDRYRAQDCRGPDRDRAKGPERRPGRGRGRAAAGQGGGPDRCQVAPGGGKVSDAKGRQRRFKNRMVFAYVMLLLIPLTSGSLRLRCTGSRSSSSGTPGQEQARSDRRESDRQFLQSVPLAEASTIRTNRPAPTPSKTNKGAHNELRSTSRRDAGRATADTTPNTTVKAAHGTTPRWERRFVLRKESYRWVGVT